MEPRYYYIRDKRTKNAKHPGKGAPVVTVCLLEDEKGYVGRGISICSGYDNPSKRKGRGLALKRAMSANKNKMNHPIPLQKLRAYTPSLESIMIASNIPYNHFKKLEEYQPELSEFELKLLYKTEGL